MSLANHPLAKIWSHRVYLLILGILMGLGYSVTPAQAHPLGNFTINQYIGLEITSEQIQIDYVLDMAEIPAFQEIRKLGLDPDHLANSSVIQDYSTTACADLRSDLSIHLDENPHSLELDTTQSGIEFPPGVGGLATLRLTCEFRSPLSHLSSPTCLHLHNRIYENRLGWREITVQGDGIPVQSPLGSESLSHRLKDYPKDLLTSPLDQRELQITVYPAAATPVVSEPLGSSTSEISMAGRQGDLMTDLLALEQLTPPTILGALVLAFLWGGFHALTPGHGKTLVGAYLVGSRGTPRHALILGLTTTITHTSSVFILGLITLVASHFLITEHLYPWLSLISGGLIVIVGLMLLRRRIQDLNSQQQQHHHHHDHDHSHPHDHSHSHSHEHTHDLPEQISWLSLLAIGFSGGILPCPSALLVLLGSITLGRIEFGLALVLAFSLGLAAVLTGVGLLFVYARDRIESTDLRLPQWQGWPALSALFVLLIGLGLTSQAIDQLL